MASTSPFGKKTRQRIIGEYFEANPARDPAGAWMHVYRLLLWIDEGTRLAHVYDANHMQKGRMFHERAKNFMTALCAKMGIAKAELHDHIDVLFKGCVEDFREARQEQQEAADPEAEDLEAELESDAVVAIQRILEQHRMPPGAVKDAARAVEEYAREFFTVGNKRKNALGEGFEDVLYRLLLDSARLDPQKVRTRQ